MAEIQQAKCKRCGGQVFRRIGERRVASPWLHKRRNVRSCAY